MSLVRSIALALCCVIFATDAVADDLSIPSSWILVTAGKSFSFRAPPGTAPYSDGGKAFDSFTGMYRNANFTLMFDYGWYSNDLSGFAHPEQTEIDGRKATIVTSLGRGEWGCKNKISAVYLVVDNSWWSKGKNKLEMNGCAQSEIGIEMLHKIFHSLKFSDTPDWRANLHFKSK